MVRLLGRRTAELHVALASTDDPDFAPEPFTVFAQRSLYQSMRNLCGRVFRLLREHQDRLPPEGGAILEVEDEILERFRSVLEGRITAMRIRCHGDYHLGQLLYTGKDFVINQFGHRYDGKPINLPQLQEENIFRVQVRYSSLRRVGFFEVPQEQS